MSNRTNISLGGIEMEEEKVIKNVMVTYDDGTSKELEKGMIISTSELGNGEINVSMGMWNMSGKDAIECFASVIEVYARLGGFDK